jgi:hypothetical protein
MSEEIEQKVVYVITCGDEGVQVNEGTRLGIIGAGFKVEGFDKVVKALKSLLGEDLRIASSEESDWVKQELELDNWDQVTASTQQHTEAIADRESLLYSGFIPFTDPRKLGHDIKAHMVRPREVHIANKLGFTLAGGEQTYNLGRFLISAEWLHKVDYKLAKKIIDLQVDFYKKLVKNDKLPIHLEFEGILGEDIANKNAKILKKMGYEPAE